MYGSGNGVLAEARCAKGQRALEQLYSGVWIFYRIYSKFVVMKLCSNHPGGRESCCFDHVAPICCLSVAGADSRSRR